MQARAMILLTTVADDDVFMTAAGFATGVAAVQKTQADLNGAEASQFQNGLGLATTLTLTTGSNVGAWSTTAPIVVTGRRNGQIVSENFQPTQANGNEALHGSQLFDPGSITIRCPAQPGTSSLKVGRRDVAGTERLRIVGVKALAAGNVVVKSAGIQQTLALADKELEEAPIDMVLAATAVAVRLYLG